MAGLLSDLVLCRDHGEAQFLRGQIVALSGLINLDDVIDYAVSAPPPTAGLANGVEVEDY